MTSRSSRLIVGLISGTSMDGIDAALVRISGPATQPRVRLMAFETLAYSAAVRQRILRVAAGDAVTAGEISQLNFLLGELFAEAALRVCRKAGVSPSRLAAIGSHGQTIFHQGPPTPGSSANLLSKVRGTSNLPPQVRGILAQTGGKTADLQIKSALRLSLDVPSTLQIAEPSVIAERCGGPVVADFRPADIAAGGQGAPLVPMVDYLLLRDARKGTVALNIGGIANFTVIPAGAKPEQVFGFDTGPGNMVIDGLVRHFSKGKKSYDAGGRWAGKGRINESLLEMLLRHPFFTRKPPKSAGREQFGADFLKRFLLEGRNLRPEDLLRTATELTARTISDALEHFVPRKIAIHRLIVSGGGAHNRLLMSRLVELLPKLRIHRSDEFGLDVDAKEAIAFAILADRTMQGLPGNLPSVTGALRPVVLGKISCPGA